MNSIQEHGYVHKVMKDIALCEKTEGDDKPLIIVSAGKSIIGYELAVTLATALGLGVETAMMRCEDGNQHEMAFIAYCEGEPQAAIKLIWAAKSGEITRPSLQFQLGSLLGYTEEQCLQFVASAEGRNCPCDCCGGPFVSEEITG